MPDRSGRVILLNDRQAVPVQESDGDQDNIRFLWFSGGGSNRISSDTRKAGHRDALFVNL